VLLARPRAQRREVAAVLAVEQMPVAALLAVPEGASQQEEHLRWSGTWSSSSWRVGMVVAVGAAVPAVIATLALMSCRV
jgi:hypothetical protein